MGTTITFRRGENDPTSGSGLTLAEPAFNTTLHTFHIGLGHGITAEWVGAPISGASADIAAGITYKIPTLAAVKNYVTSTSITDYVSSFNGLTGAVTGVTVGGANVFTALNSFNAGICASGITLSSGIINAPSAGLYLTSSNTKNAKINLLSGPSSSQVELDAITVRVRNTTDGALPTFELYEATDAYSAKMQYASSATNDATITFPAITGTVALTNQVVTSVNGKTGAVQGVESFNGLTGAVGGVTTSAANTFTAVQTFNSGVTFASTVDATGAARLSGGLTASRIDVTGNFKVVGDAQIGDQNTDTLTVFAGTTFNNHVNFGGTNVFRYGLTSGGAIRFSGNNAKTILTSEASLTITGATSSVIASPYNSMVFGVQTSDPLTMYSATGVVDIATNNPLTPMQPALRFNTDDQDFIGPGSIKIEPIGYATSARTQYLQDASGTLALTSQLMGAINGSTAATTAVTSFNGLTGAVGGVCAAQANTFTALQTFTTGISAAGGMTLDGGKVWHSLNDGPTSGLDAGQLYGVTANIYASSLATGLLYGGLVTINAGNSAAFDVTAGAGYIVTTGATFTAEPNPVITRVSWTAKTGVTLAGLTAQDTTWIYFDSSGNLQQQATFFTDDQVQSTIAIGALVHPSRSFISLARTIPNVSYATDKQYEQFIRAFGPLKVSGHTVQANGANLKLNRTSGTAFILGRNYPNNPDNPSVVTDGAKTDAEIWRYYRGVTAGSFVTVTGATAVDPVNYDNGSGTLANVPSNKPFSIQRIFFFPNTPDVLAVYYGREVYASLAEAANNITLEDFTEVTNTATNAVLLGYLIVKYNATNLTTEIAAGDARIIEAGQFRSTTSGGGTIATNLDGLSDVVITGGITNDHVLVYVNGLTGWQDIAVSSLISKYGVTSFNGSTGAVTGLAANTANTFTGLQTFTAGISASGGITFNSNISAPNIVNSFNGLTGAVTGVTVGGENTFTALNSFSAGLSASGGITFGSTAAFSNSIVLQNSEYIRNTTNGQLDLMPAPAGSTAFGLYADMTSWSFGVILGTIRTSDGAKNTGGNLRFDVPLTVNTATRFQLGSDGNYGFYRTDTGNNTGQIYAYCDGANNSGAITLVGYADVGAANRSPATTHSNPNLYIYANGTASANDFVRFDHDRTNANIVSGGTSGILIQPGSGTVAVSGNLTANNIVNAVNGKTGGVTFAAGTGITLNSSGNTITIASTVSGGSSNSTTQTLDFSELINHIEVVIWGSGNDFGTSLQYIENNTNIITLETPTNQYSGVLQSIESFKDPTNGWSARIIMKPPFTGGSSTTAEDILAETVITVYIDTTSSGGANVADFWQNFTSQTLIHKEATYTIKTVTGQTWVAADSFITCKVLGLTTADHIPEDASLEGVRFEIDNIVAGTGFDIIGHAPEGTYGKYSVKCLGQ